MIALAVKQVAAAMTGAVVFFLGAIHDIVAAAAIAGVFTLANTWLNARLHRHVKRIRETARESTDAMRELVEQEDRQ